MRRLLRRTLRAARNAVVGPPDTTVINEVMRRDPRTQMFLTAAEYINYEAVAGDVFEFGVFAGLSLVNLAQCCTYDTKGMTRGFVGFDSFEGLPASSEHHARWQERDCARTFSWHPLVPVGTAVSPQLVVDLFRACDMPTPALHAGDFSATIPAVVPARYPAIALVHVDCDLYESTQVVLEGIAPALQDGTMILFDDWFHYRGHPSKGEARAFSEFLARHPEWEAVHYRAYATFCNAFILSRR